MTSQTARAPTPQPPVLLRQTRGSIAVLTLNRPDARNSLSEGLITELHAALTDIHDDASVAAVQGVATAAGCQLVASCDLAVASEAATFATPGVDIGLFCSTPMVALSRNVPRKQAVEMGLTGEPVSATTARDIGLVNRVVAAGTERDAAIALAQKVALKSAY